MNIPNHVAIILDGNGRWAQSRGLPRSFGHIRGCANLENVVEDAKELGIRYLTVYAFSTENWKRSQDEVRGLMKLFRGYLKKCIRISEKNRICMRVIGDTSAFDPDMQESIRHLEDFSKDFDEMYFQIALNYGSRDELTRAVRKIAARVCQGDLRPEEITEKEISGYLDTAGLPDPDLLIRTSGEQRLSNYLLWQLAYTEFYFTDVHWPDFGRDELLDAIRAYNKRDRRYGNAQEEQVCLRPD